MFFNIIRNPKKKEKNKGGRVWFSEKIAIVRVFKATIFCLLFKMNKRWVESVLMYNIQ